MTPQTKIHNNKKVLRGSFRSTFRFTVKSLPTARSGVLAVMIVE